MNYLPLPEAARELGYSASWLYRKIQRGDIKAKKVNGQWQVPESEVYTDEEPEPNGEEPEEETRPPIKIDTGQNGQFTLTMELNFVELRSMLNLLSRLEK